ncbi:MAG: hypothetical protein K9W43_14305, partial [Candidatus Thorarchaeota archaeon]|nr:hypothetical protein [Candidatus Thorarchaeota archaeon]
MILKAISCSFGNNNAFIGYEKWRGWPTNDTIISERPIIKVGETYYIFSPTMLIRNRVEIIEALLEQYSPDYYQKQYLPARDSYVENTALNLFQNLLPNSSIYKNLFYYIGKDKSKRVELDGLILYDDCLLLIEAKAGMLPQPARRGSIKGLKHKAKHILREAHSQALRALDYIQSSSKVRFVDRNGNHIASVERDRFKHIYLIIVTFEPMFVLTSHLSSVKRLGLLAGENWPWAVD